MCTTYSGRATTIYQGSIHPTANTIKRDENPETRGGGCRERDRGTETTRSPPHTPTYTRARLRPSRGVASSVHLPFFPSIVSSRSVRGKKGEEKREAIPGDGLDGKTKHPGGCLRAAPVIRLAGGELWSLAPASGRGRRPPKKRGRRDALSGEQNTPRVDLIPCWLG